MFLVKNNMRQFVENESHVAAFLNAGWKKEAEKQEKKSEKIEVDKKK